MSVEELSLGHSVRDISTGLTGIATGMVETFDGNIRFVIQPPLPEEDTDSKLPDGFEIDIQMLEFVDEGVFAYTATAADDDIVLGQTVKSIVTGFKGIALNRVTYMNGCVQYQVVPKMQKKKGNFFGEPKGCFISPKLLEIVDEGISSHLTNLDPSGGPTTIAIRM